MPHCNACNNDFKDISELRKHQWAAHKTFYKNNTKKRMANKAAKTLPSVKMNGNLSAQDLLERLKIQRDFMNDIVDMVEGMMSKDE